MANTLTLTQLQAVQDSLTTGNTAATWQLLSSFGDVYAGAAYQVVAQPNSIYGIIARDSWTEAGADLTQFNAVAAAHLKNYVNDISNSFDAATGGYKLPDTTAIETSYSDALKASSISQYAAIDFSVSSNDNRQKYGMIAGSNTVSCAA